MLINIGLRGMMTYAQTHAKKCKIGEQRQPKLGI